MADHVWMDVPTGALMELATSGTDAYLADAHVHFDMKAGPPPRADYAIPEEQLDPGPSTIDVPNAGTVAVTVGIIFVKPSATTVTVTAVIKKADGTNFTEPFSKPYQGIAGDGKQTCVIMARGDGV